MRLIETVTAMQADRGAGPRAVVMTMGALHRGHAALIDHARALIGPDGDLVVTVFVNPLQFGPGEDYERYPRTWEQDLTLCSEHGVDAVFAPDAADMYASGRDITVAAGPLGEILEGIARPGHFSGMLTVVNKLLQQIAADTALFGEKDYQQLVLVRRMAAQFNLPVTIVGSPTVREPDGLALSSRNVYLSAEERLRAQVMPAATAAAQQAAAAGGSADAIAEAAQAVFRAASITPDYVALTDRELGPAPQRGAARLLIAARIGQPRLLDNVAIAVDPE